MDIAELRQTVWDYYHEHGRDLPWRRPLSNGKYDPYRILVSEIMLQQTQVARVVPKYTAFLKRFSGIGALSDAPLSAVLTEWNGLGYNRRAKYLHEAAKALGNKPEPWTLSDLTACTGIGANTAAAVLTYAYDQLHVFIETNVRTVFIHHFFPEQSDIADKSLLPLIAETVDAEHPREFYWALMDYGVFIKATAGNASRSSKHYAKQSAFAGSRRQVRGQILRLLRDKSLARPDLVALVPDERLEGVVADLVREGLVTENAGRLHLG